MTLTLFNNSGPLQHQPTSGSALKQQTVSGYAYYNCGYETQPWAHLAWHPHLFVLLQIITANCLRFLSWTFTQFSIICRGWALQNCDGFFICRGRIVQNCDGFPICRGRIVQNCDGFLFNFWWKKSCLYHVRQVEKPYYHASRWLTSGWDFQQCNRQTRGYWVQQDLDHEYIS